MDLNTFTQTLEKISKHTTNNPIRFALYCVCLEVTEEKELNIIATDGRLLSKIEAGTSIDVSALDAGNYLIHKDEVKKLRALFKGNEDQTVITKATVNSIAIGGNETASYSIQLSEGIFPNYRLAIPQHDNKQTIGLDAEYLRKIASIIDKEKGKRYITLELRGSNEPIILHYTNHMGAYKEYSVLMPMTERKAYTYES